MRSNVVSVGMIFVGGMLFAGALNRLRWSVWPISGGPMIGSDPRTSWPIFGWLDSPPSR